MTTKKPNTTRVSKSTEMPAKSKEAPKRALTTTQTAFLDLAGDLIVNGGDPEDLQMLVSAVLKHEEMHFQRMRDPRHRDSSSPRDEARRKAAAEHVERNGVKRAAELIAKWPEPAVPREDRPATTATEMAREDIRHLLREHFEQFLVRGTPEEQRLLCGVFGYWETSNIGPFERETYCPLVENFMMELGSSDTFVRVSEKHVERVREFVALLEPCGKEAA